MAVYLLHFSRPINPNRPAQHYIGYTPRSVAERNAMERQLKSRKDATIKSTIGLSQVSSVPLAGENGDTV